MALREMIFRAKTVFDDKWVYGDLYTILEHGKRYPTIHTIDDDGGDILQVTPATVGQYTGLTDKNDTKIFEGDIVRRHEEPFNLDNIGIVVYDKVTGSFRLNVEKYGTLCGYSFVSTDTYNDGYCTVGCKVTFEVLGNKFDNPELIKN